MYITQYDFLLQTRIVIGGGGLWCLTPLSTTFQLYQIIIGVSFNMQFIGTYLFICLDIFNYHCVVFMMVWGDNNNYLH
jgi:hypothetical protein